ncbi:MAG: radical SAM protein [Candidatus Marsarchaeota archaeon]|nr:radical SAM protein [Candidatus Marsarchaeota archaeon]MCL5094836.1 radical SAM protein [Candidatus Marsarchaeota archaeon]
MIKQLIGLSLNILKSNFGELKKPYKLNFCITYKCNSRCKTCNIWKINAKNELSIDEIKLFADKNRYFKWIELTGGEVFLRNDFVDIIKTFKASNPFIVTFPTNCLVNETLMLEKIKQILELKIPRIAITLSLDGNEQMHDYIRGIPGNYKKTINMFKQLNKLKKNHKNLFFVFGYTISKYNQGHFNEAFESIKQHIPDIKYNDFHINIAQQSDNYYGNKEDNTLIPDKQIVLKELREIVKNREFEFSAIQYIESKFLKKLIEFIETRKQPMKSKSLIDSLFIDAYGNIFPSIMWNMKIDNIKNINFDLNNIWAGKKADEIRKMIKENKEPVQWTSCEAYQSIVSEIFKF